jgi:hypothetical protein
MMDTIGAEYVISGGQEKIWGNHWHGHELHKPLEFRFELILSHLPLARRPIHRRNGNPTFGMSDCARQSK